MRVVLANGCFDLLHVAHVRHLREARSMGDMLVVGLTMDKHVNKPGRPIIGEDERREMLLALRCVTAVCLCKDSIDALEQVRPDVFCKGDDYVAKGLLREEIEYCMGRGIEIAHTKPNPQTTSGLVERIKCS